MISKTAARFLVVAGVFNVVIWPRFAKAVVDDDRAWAGEHWHSTPQAFFWVHAVLITTAIVISSQKTKQEKVPTTTYGSR